MNRRTHTCGELTSTNISEKVCLNGWVNAVRFHGQVVFVDIRDRYGKTQIVYNQDSFKSDFELVKKLSMEDVLSVKGVVQKRDKNAINPNIATGEIEVIISDHEILNEAEPLDDAGKPGGIIYPSLDPMVWEIKYPNKDIRGRSVTL